MIFVLVLIALPSLVGAQVILEDWDTTPESPDVTRGWDRDEGPALVLSEPERGNFITTDIVFTAPLLAVPDAQGVTSDFSNGFVGEKSYLEMGVSKFSYLARLDETQAPSGTANTSLLLLTDQFVPDPKFGGFVRPRIWLISEEQVSLDEGWKNFEFEVDFSSDELPTEWRAYPDSNETWNLVKNDVDQVIVYFTAYQYGLISLPSRRGGSLDDFRVQLGPHPVAVPLVQGRFLSIVATLILLTGLVWLYQRA
jgi:hypothetical protein